MRLFGFDARRCHHALPQNELTPNHSAEFLRRTDADLGAEASSRARVGGSFRLSRNAALSFSMISGRVPAGATTPSQNGEFSLGKPASAVVGTSGSFELRSLEVTAIARTDPD